MSETFVIPSGETFGVGVGSSGGVRGYIGWRNDLAFSTVTGSAIDVAYPALNLFDHNPRTECSTDAFDVEQEIIFSWPTARPLDYFGLMSKNGLSALASIKIQYLDSVSALYVDLCESTLPRDGQPYSYYFGNDFDAGKVETTSIKLLINSQSKFYITAAHCGLAQTFTEYPNVNFRPGRMNPQHKSIESKTYSNMAIASYLIEGGYKEVAQYDLLSMSDVKQWMPDLHSHMYAKKYLFYSHNTKKPLESVYGLQKIKSIPKPKFDRTIHTTVSFEFDCFA